MASSREAGGAHFLTSRNDGKKSGKVKYGEKLDWDNYMIYIYIIILIYKFHHIHQNLDWDNYTSSTVQGGGGSFKNRKPIGELGCCESGMAERSH